MDSLSFTLRNIDVKKIISTMQFQIYVQYQ